MPYSYDKRAASNDEADDKEAKERERLEDLAGMCGDAVVLGEDLLNELDKRTESDALSAPRKFADDILDNLRYAESAEKLSDFVGCIKAVQEEVPKLEAALKVAKREAKDNGGDEPDQVALDAIEEAVDYLRSVKKEVREIAGEIAETERSD